MRYNSILEYCSNHDYVFCYGAGKYGRVIREYLTENGIEIDGYVVSSNATTIGQSVLGVPVISLSEFLKKRLDNTGLIIGVSNKYHKEITYNLSVTGFTDMLVIDDDLFCDIERKCEYRNRYASSNNITVFCYHRVADLPLDTWKLAVKPKLFEKQIAYIKDNYIIMKSEDEWEQAKGKSAAVITFDDGYEDVYSNVLPILEKFDVPATIFVCTGNLDTTNEFWWDELERIVFSSSIDNFDFEINGKNYAIKSGTNCEETCYRLHPYLKMMDYKNRKLVLKKWQDLAERIVERDYCRSLGITELKRLSESPLITIGGHTVTHSCLACETIEQQEWEIKESKKEIEKLIGREIEVFSYPFGQRTDFTDNTVNIAQRTGYKKIFAAYTGLTNANYQNGYIPRVNIGQESDYYSSIRLLRQFETVYGDEWV